MPGATFRARDRPDYPCPDCYREEQLLWEVITGKCASCHGSGFELALHRLDHICRKCKGTRICPTCGGTALRNFRLSLTIQLMIVLTDQKK
jgi:hypothetical protein